MRIFKHELGVPSDSAIKYSASTNRIKNNPITRRDMLLSVGMLGRRKHGAEGKTTMTQYDAVSMTMKKIDIPMTIRQFHNNVELSVYVELVNNMPFLISTLEHIYHGTVSAADNWNVMPWKPRRRKFHGLMLLEASK